MLAVSRPALADDRATVAMYSVANTRYVSVELTEIGNLNGMLGHVYGTVLIDCETGPPVEVLGGPPRRSSQMRG